MGWLDNWRKLDTTVLEVPAGFEDSCDAVVVFSAVHRRHALFADILVEEVRRRSRAEWTRFVEDTEARNSSATFGAQPRVIRLQLVGGEDGQVANEALEEDLGDEGYHIHMEAADEDGCPGDVTISATRDRGLLFGVGRLLREMRMDFHISYAKPLSRLCAVPAGLDIASRPTYAMRQHQIAYRPKTNSYDAFTPEMMKQEILDVALFGCNAIECIPPGIDDALQSPSFTIPWLDMLKVVSQWCCDLDLRVSMWYPAFFKSYEDPDSLEQARAHWTTIMENLHRLDVLFVPGGDPGGRPADEFFRAVELQAAFVREHFFPDVEVWVSSQYGLSTSVDLGLTEPWVPLVQEQLWMEMLRTPRVRAFLDGVVYGPWSCVPIDEFRAQVPDGLPLRNYPDLCHVQTAQMPCFGWDLSFAVTNGRESINPRPREMLAIIQEQAPYTIGCGCYSEGVNDDINKHVWTALHWGGDVRGPLADASPERILDAMLRQYVSFLMEQPRNVDALVEGIYQLERNWSGDLLASESVPRSQAIFTKAQNSLAPRHRRNWRLNMLLFRANHDAFMYARLKQERACEANALSALRDGSCSATELRNAAAALAVPYYEPPITMSSFNSPSTPNPLMVTSIDGSSASCTHLYGQLMALAATLYHQIGMQLSTGYGGQHRQRGAYFDLVWAPLGDVVSINRVVQRLLADDDAARGEHLRMSPTNGVGGGVLLDSETSRDAHLVRRFRTALREHTGDAAHQVLWYASFGDEGAHELPGCPDAPTRPIPVDQVLPPHHPIDQGQDPMYFTRPMVEYLDASNDTIIRDLHDGLIPRCWRSYLVPIWPRTARYAMHFDLDKLGIQPDQIDSTSLTIRVTYLGNDINRHGGDWEELDRQAQPTRMLANGVKLHAFLDPAPHTQMLELDVPAQVLRRARQVGTLILTWEPRVAHKTTFRFVPIPIAELWVLKKRLSDTPEARL